MKKFLETYKGRRDPIQDQEREEQYEPQKDEVRGHRDHKKKKKEYRNKYDNEDNWN